MANTNTFRTERDRFGRTIDLAPGEYLTSYNGQQFLHKSTGIYRIDQNGYIYVSPPPNLGTTPPPTTAAPTTTMAPQITIPQVTIPQAPVTTVPGRAVTPAAAPAAVRTPAAVPAAAAPAASKPRSRAKSAPGASGEGLVGSYPNGGVSGYTLGGDRAMEAAARVPAALPGAPTTFGGYRVGGDRAMEMAARDRALGGSVPQVTSATVQNPITAPVDEFSKFVQGLGTTSQAAPVYQRPVYQNTPGTYIRPADYNFTPTANLSGADAKALWQKLTENMQGGYSTGMPGAGAYNLVPTASTVHGSGGTPLGYMTAGQAMVSNARNLTDAQWASPEVQQHMVLLGQEAGMFGPSSAEVQKLVQQRAQAQADAYIQNLNNQLAAWQGAAGYGAGPQVTAFSGMYDNAGKPILASNTDAIRQQVIDNYMRGY